MTSHMAWPWQIVEREVFDDESVYPRHIVGGPDELVVCYLESQYAASTSASVRREATDRLIAAAPELLEMVLELKAELELIAMEEGAEPYNNPRLNSVLTKATGAA